MLQDRWLKQYQVLEQLKIGRKKLKEMVIDGLPYYEIDNKTIYYKVDDIEDYLETKKVKVSDDIA